MFSAWRGAAPVQHAILHGDEITGASTFRIEKGLDTGPVFGYFRVQADPRLESHLVTEHRALLEHLEEMPEVGPWLYELSQRCSPCWSRW